MDLTYAELSSPGPARENNEDFVGFWQPETVEEKRQRGAIAILCDGVGGQGHGEVASRLAVETGLKTFPGNHHKTRGNRGTGSGKTTVTGNFDLHNNLGIGGAKYEHSAEFNETFMQQWRYWQQLLTDFGLDTQFN